MSVKVYENDTLTTFNACGLEGYQYGPFSVMAVDQQNRVWVGTSSGSLCLLDVDGLWVDYTPFGQDITFFAFNTIAVDPQGRIWTDLGEGVSVFNPPAP
jgi:hypothetical protein